jgi:hypothetical protein
MATRRRAASSRGTVLTPASALVRVAARSETVRTGSPESVGASPGGGVVAGRGATPAGGRVGGGLRGQRAGGGERRHRRRQHCRPRHSHRLTVQPCRAIERARRRTPAASVARAAPRLARPGRPPWPVVHDPSARRRRASRAAPGRRPAPCARGACAASAALLSSPRGGYRIHTAH